MKLTWILLALVIVVAALVGIAVLRKTLRGRAPGDEPWPFYVRRPLSQPEQVFFHRLVSSLPEHFVLAQVQLSRFLAVRKGFNFHEWNNRINRLSVDFLVCAKDASVIAAIELDDASHDRASRVEADTRRSKALRDAGVRLLRWRVNAPPDNQAIRQELLQDVAQH